MKRSIFIALFSVLVSAQTHAWTITANFESGTIGAKAEGHDAFGGAKSLTVFDNKHVKSGSQSAKATITQGSDGWTEWGGVWNFPTFLYQGDEIWYRMWVYLQPGWNWGGGSKGTRIHTRSSSGANEGYIDTYGYNDRFRVGSELNTKMFFENNGSKESLPSLPTGSWECVELYVKFNATPGQGIYRIWRNGVLAFEDTQTYTLRQSTSHSNLFFLFGYFNSNWGGSPQTQSLWIDDVVITNQRPSNMDSHGNSFIGTGQTKNTSGTSTAPPRPPSIVE